MQYDTETQAAAAETPTAVYHGPQVRTFDTCFAGFLLARGIPLDHTVFGRLVRFYFDDADGRASALEDEYFDGNAQVNARAHSRAMRKIQRILHYWHETKAQCQSPGGNAHLS